MTLRICYDRQIMTLGCYLTQAGMDMHARIRFFSCMHGCIHLQSYST